MSIYSTQTIHRCTAIERIKEVLNKTIPLYEEKNWYALEKLEKGNSEEVLRHCVLLKTYLQEWGDIVEYWTDNMLEDAMDLAVCRWSFFENYNVVEDYTNIEDIY